MAEPTLTACPACGRAVMLCGECHQGESVTRCDWSNETNRCFRSTVDAHCGEKPPVRKPRTGPENGEKDESCCILNRDEATALWEAVKHSYLKKWLVDENEERTLESLYHFIGGYMKVKAIAEVGGKV